MPDSQGFEPQERQALYGSSHKASSKSAASLVRRSLKKPATYLLLLIIIACGFGVYYFARAGSKWSGPDESLFPKVELPLIGQAEEWGFEKFTSEEELKQYLEESEGSAFFGVSTLSFSQPQVELRTDSAAEIGAAGEFFNLTGGAERVSETNVQVLGIDEPDIVKTDGQQIYFSPQSNYRIFSPRPLPVMSDARAMLPPDNRFQTKVIRAFPPTDLSLLEEISQAGNLLLAEDILVIFTQDRKIYGFDISDPRLPVEKWQVKLDERQSLVSARLFQDKIYLLSSGYLEYDHPCPLNLLSSGQESVTARCIDIYHPVRNMTVDVTYSAFVLDPEDGDVQDKVTFVGSADNSVLYVSGDNLYVSFAYGEDYADFLIGFFESEGRDLLPASLLERLQKLKSYDLTQEGKLMEFMSVLEKYQNSLTSDEKLKMESEMGDRLDGYMDKHLRDLEKTGLVKISLENMAVKATASFPGRLLNQFALDEYQGNLRVATTVGASGFGGSTRANDVYVFDERLRQIGSILNLGLEERIYSARFLGDKGYLVTFRQVDPFYVLDLSDPKKPEVKGELKIPGYSSYLHPIGEDKVLGIGKEGSKVKISLFDVSSPENPAEVSKYVMDEYWSDILNNHHAFLLDNQHRVFFVPGSKGGYVFSYQGDNLKMVRAVADVQARRAVYLDDYLYIIGDNEIVVLNENDWQEVNQLDLVSDSRPRS